MKRAAATIVLGLTILCQTRAQNPPTISTICPATLGLLPAEVPNFNLTILGSGFQPGAIVLWNAGTAAPVQITPASMSAKVIRAVVPATLVPSPITSNATVQSIPVAVSVGAVQSPIVNITTGVPPTQFCALDPNETTAGVATFRTTIYGAGLSSVGLRFTVNWTIGQLTGPAQNVTSDPSGTALDVTLPPEALSTPGSVTLTPSFIVIPPAITFHPLISGPDANGGVTVTVNPRPTLSVPTFEHGYVSIGYATKTVHAQGGTHPLRWSVRTGGLPPGLTLTFSPLDDSVATISGTPSQAITSLETFNFNVAATDSAPGTPVTVQQPATVAIEPLPALQYFNVPPDHQAVPADQLSILLGVQQPSSLNIAGNVSLSFSPDQGVPFPSNSNQQVGFLEGRTISAAHSYSVPPNCALPNCGQPLTLQAGNVAGSITLHITSLTTTDPNLPAGPLTPGDQTITMPKLIPSVDPAQISIRNVAGGFEVCIPGFSTPRDMATATFRFVPTDKANLHFPPEPHDVTGAFASWYQSANSLLGGSNFTYVQPFTVQGDAAAIGSLFVTLTNSVGSTAEFGPIDLRTAPRCNAAF
jgi:hypothetical protein